MEPLEAFYEVIHATAAIDLLKGDHVDVVDDVAYFATIPIEGTLACAMHDAKDGDPVDCIVAVVPPGFVDRAKRAAGVP